LAGQPQKPLVQSTEGAGVVSHWLRPAQQRPPHFTFVFGMQLPESADDQQQPG
jgi:hypothetical protein